MKRKALGKGLSALLPDPEPADSPPESTSTVPVSSLEPNPFQPRNSTEMLLLPVWTTVAAL